MYFSFLSFQIHYPFVHWSCDHLVIANIVLFSLLYIYIYIHDVVIISPISPHVISFLSLYTCFFYVCNLLFLFHSKMP